MRMLRKTAAMLAVLTALTIATGAEAKSSCDDIDNRCKQPLSTGITMSYMEFGPKSGTPVILIHGLTDSVRSWSTTIPFLLRFDRKLHIFAVDLRGHGGSTMPPRRLCATEPESCFEVKDFADDVTAFMKAKKINSTFLVGHSLGTFVTQEIALDSPSMVRGAVLVATAAKATDNAVLRDYVLNEPVEGSWKKALEARGKRYPIDFYDEIPASADKDVEKWLAANWDVDPLAPDSFLRPYLPETAHVRLGTWIGATMALLATDHTERLKKLSVPTFVIWGSQDNIFPASDQEQVRQLLTEAAKRRGGQNFWKQYGMIPLPASGAQESDVGHNVQWGAPEAVAKDIVSFIETGKPLDARPAAKKTSDGFTIVEVKTPEGFVGLK